VRRHYPHLHLAGRLGSFRYLDMYQAAGQALALAGRLFPARMRVLEEVM
jgi:UDP-galactopyranose mutase